jgi:hypothetical protein
VRTDRKIIIFRHTGSPNTVICASISNSKPADRRVEVSFRACKTQKPRDEHIKVWKHAQWNGGPMGAKNTKTQRKIPVARLPFWSSKLNYTTWNAINMHK